MKPILWIVVPCYNEQEVLPITAPIFLAEIGRLTAAGLVSDQSRVCFVNDGSRDATWQLICDFAKADAHYIGISQSRNRGHQAAVSGSTSTGPRWSTGCAAAGTPTPSSSGSPPRAFTT